MPAPSTPTNQQTPDSSFATPLRKLRGDNVTSTPVSEPYTPSDNMSMSDMSSLGASPLETTLTPNIKGLSVGKKRGRPRKELLPPSYDDCPENATPAQIKKWKAAKKSAEWRYKKKMGAEGAQYRMQENKRSTSYYYRKKDNGSGDENFDEEDEASIEELIEEKESEDKAKKREQSRVR